MARRLEKLVLSVLCGAVLGLAGCESEPGEDASADAYGPPADASSEDSSADLPEAIEDSYDDPLYGAPWDA